MGPVKAILPLLLMLLAIASCSRYELELYDDGKADIHFTYDWMSKYQDIPDGMTFMWARDTDLITYYDPTHRVEDRTDRLPSGTYYFTMMNLTFGEYSTMKFTNRNSHENLMAVANTYTITSDNAWDKNRIYMEEPENIGVATDTVEIPETIDDVVFRNWKDTSTVEDLHIKRYETIMPMTTTLIIHVKVRGISYMRSLEGYITGLATGFYLNQAWRTTQVGNIKLDHWERDYKYVDTTETEPNVGWMTTSVKTFGLPHGRELLSQRTPASNYILLHFILIDGRAVDFSYQVGLNIRYKGDNGELDVFERHDVTLELNLKIDAPFYQNDEVPILPYSQPDGSGQFDAEVEPWGDDVNVDIPM